MSQTVNVNFRLNSELKKNVEEICHSMGMNLTTMLTICCKKIEQERCIPFEIRAEADPYYSAPNLLEIKKRYQEVKDGTASLEEHPLIESGDRPYA